MKIKEIDLKCEYCGSIYHVDSRRALKITRYCSKECFNKSRFGKNNPVHRIKDRKAVNKKISYALRHSEKFLKANKSEEKKRKLKEWHKNNKRVITEETRQKYRENALRTLKKLQESKSTKIERLTEKKLRDFNILYETQKSFLGITRVDFYIPGLNTIIYCDGDYWHNLPEYKKRDERQNKKLREAGYTVLRFWEHEINETNAQCVIDALNKV